jgi:hypothetical protein
LLSPVDTRLLRRCYEEGDFGHVSDWYGDGSLLDALVLGRRARLTGRDAIIAQLSAWWPGPGELLRWQVDELASGLTIELERTVNDGVCRQRQFIWLEREQVVRQQVYSARPQSALGAPAPSQVAERLLSGLGEVVERAPLSHLGQAGGWIERVAFADGRRVVLKRVVPERDFQGQVAGVSAAREALLWQTGMIQRLLPDVDAAIIAAAAEEDQAVLIMRDVSSSLVGAAGPLTTEQNRRLLDALATLHRKLAGAHHESLIGLESYLTMTTPARLAPVLQGDDYIPKVMAVGWEVFADVAPRDVVETVLAQHADPAPLGGLLRACGSGVVHGDFRGANLALEPGRVVVLDWGLATEAPGVIDLAWYVFVNGWRIDAPKEELVAAYVARVSDLYDERTLKLGLLGGFCWFGGLLSHELIESDAAKRERARQELGWWCRRIREAAELL